MTRGINAESPPPSEHDRRPIAARRLAVFAAMAAALARARVRPNAISIAGMLAAIGAGGLLAMSGAGEAGSLSERAMLLAAAGLVQARLLANLLDGMVAVEGGLRSPTGELYNEVPDRVSDVAVLIGAGYAAGAWPELGYLAAIGAVLVAYSRAIGKGCGFAADFRGPMAKQQRMFIVTLACVWMGCAPVAWRGAWMLAGAERGVMAAALAIITIGCALTFLRRLGLVGARLCAADQSRSAA
ncbi:MAG: CDP-alcohol phosphatidyltransferase family protein [Phycisphaeraceae bacterium]|nr:CDP-alcohol phosphatidyltransferase family protein [Phycisphaeraceae bacterium]